jgi:hypothetical protein
MENLYQGWDSNTKTLFSMVMSTQKLVLAFFLALVMSPVFPAQVDDMMIRDHLRKIYQITGMSIPEKDSPEYPKILFVDQDFIEQMACKGEACDAPAFTKGPTVFMADDLDLAEILGESILYHELVHVLQYYNYGGNDGCKSWSKRELQAYQLQEEFVNERGYDMPWLRSVTHYLAAMCDRWHK